jgi:hypothetical protein
MDAVARQVAVDGFDELDFFIEELFVTGLGVFAAIILESDEFAVETAEEHNVRGEGLEVGLKLAGGGLVDQELGDLGGSGLEADFGEVGGGVAAEVFNEVVLVEAGGDGEFLLESPFVVAAAGGPVGDVAFRDGDGVLGEGLDDLGVGDAVLEHAADQVAVGLGKAGDDAVAASFAESKSRLRVQRADDGTRAVGGGRRTEDGRRSFGNYE